MPLPLTGFTSMTLPSASTVTSSFTSPLILIPARINQCSAACNCYECRPVRRKTRPFLVGDPHAILPLMLRLQEAAWETYRREEKLLYSEGVRANFRGCGVRARQWQFTCSKQRIRQFEGPLAAKAAKVRSCTDECCCSRHRSNSRP